MAFPESNAKITIIGLGIYSRTNRVISQASKEDFSYLLYKTTSCLEVKLFCIKPLKSLISIKFSCFS